MKRLEEEPMEKLKEKLVERLEEELIERLEEEHLAERLVEAKLMDMKVMEKWMVVVLLLENKPLQTNTI